MLDSTETIAAIATPLAPAPRGIVRLSGSQAWTVASAHFVPDDPHLSLSPTRASRIPGSLRVSGLRVPVPAWLGLWPAPRTYTGQFLAEIHTTGSVPIVQAVLTDCLAQGARLAEPGEFTLRAFLAGRIDLTQAEAVLGVIEAGQPAQLQAALAQLAGGLSQPLRKLREGLLDLVAHLEATLDFVEEPDVDDLERSRLAQEMESHSIWLADLARQFTERDRPERLPRVVLVGAPNVGKSRLFNALVENGQALVADQSGTTRDYLTGICHCGDLVVELIDTAGAEPTLDEILAMAQHHQSQQLAAADLVLLCRSPQQGLPTALLPAQQQATLRVWTQSDRATPTEPGWIATSAASGAGIPTLKAAIQDQLQKTPGQGDAAALTTGARCRESLNEASLALQDASSGLSLHVPQDLVSLDLRAAIDALGAVLGQVVTDDILDRIFSRFCIGK